MTLKDYEKRTQFYPSPKSVGKEPKRRIGRNAILGLSGAAAVGLLAGNLLSGAGSDSDDKDSVTDTQAAHTITILENDIPGSELVVPIAPVEQIDSEKAKSLETAQVTLDEYGKKAAERILRGLKNPAVGAESWEYGISNKAAIVGPDAVMGTEDDKAYFAMPETGVALTEDGEHIVVFAVNMNEDDKATAEDDESFDAAHVLVKLSKDDIERVKYNELNDIFRSPFLTADDYLQATNNPDAHVVAIHAQNGWGFDSVNKTSFGETLGVWIGDTEVHDDGSLALSYALDNHLEKEGVLKSSGSTVVEEGQIESVTNVAAKALNRSSAKLGDLMSR